MSPPEQFATRMDIIAQNMIQETELMMKKVAFAIDQSVVLATPVDTGRARGNWIVSFGSPLIHADYNRFSKTGALSIGRAKTTLDRYKLSFGDIYITNSIDYIRTLNRGSSQQAPSRFVEKATLAGRALIQSSRLIKKPGASVLVV